MNPLPLIIAVLSGLMAFGFLLGSLIPLTGIGSHDANQNEADPVSWYTQIADLILMLYDTLPIFAIFRAILGVRELPAMARAMKSRWLEDKGIRQCFRFGIISLFVFGISLAAIFQAI